MNLESEKTNELFYSVFLIYEIFIHAVISVLLLCSVSYFV